MFDLQVNYLLRAGVPIERHATIVYTRNLFERFYKELFLSGSFLCVPHEEDNKFIVTYARSSSSAVGRREYVVRSDETKMNYWCVCKSFEHSGIPCRHVLKVCGYMLLNVISQFLYLFVLRNVHEMTHSFYRF
jgi:hypothetical protein